LPIAGYQIKLLTNIASVRQVRSLPKNCLPKWELQASVIRQILADQEEERSNGYITEDIFEMFDAHYKSLCERLKWLEEKTQEETFKAMKQYMMANGYEENDFV